MSNEPKHPASLAEAEALSRADCAEAHHAAELGALTPEDAAIMADVVEPAPTPPRKQ